MTTRTNSRTGIARYQQVYTVLAQALAEGTIGAGQALPSEPTLVRQYGVSRTTVRRALERLAAEGSIIRRRGSGTFARNGLQRSGSARKFTRILDDLRGLGANTDSTLIHFERNRTPEFLLRESPDFGGEALVVRRLRSVDNQPVMLVTIYVPERLASLLTPHRIRDDAVMVAFDKLGYRAVTAEQLTTAVAADPLTAQYLKCPVGAALLNVRRLTRDVTGKIVDFANFVYSPDCYEVRTLIERGVAVSRSDAPPKHRPAAPAQPIRVTPGRAARKTNIRIPSSVVRKRTARIPIPAPEPAPSVMSKARTGRRR